MRNARADERRVVRRLDVPSIGDAMTSRDRKPRDLAERLAARNRAAHDGAARADGYKRATFRLPRAEARAKAREILDRFPPPAYMTAIESWAELPGDVIEFTIRRLPSAD
jgi:hypothetical protein